MNFMSKKGAASFSIQRKPFSACYREDILIGAYEWISAVSVNPKLDLLLEGWLMHSRQILLSKYFESNEI